ncbi:Chitin synthase regulatory factor 3 [Smittium culicis]|uniref:Chitin synthase regulatory factor 3 n=1 Tax=Smittium culicis TaxID=133412 RepID=A0A1R1X1V7_9FUNG|nr:Chitin synthase regulatory factor 3 [Smittium culicis]
MTSIHQSNFDINEGFDDAYDNIYELGYITSSFEDLDKNKSLLEEDSDSTGSISQLLDEWSAFEDTLESDTKLTYKKKQDTKNKLKFQENHNSILNITNPEYLKSHQNHVVYYDEGFDKIDHENLSNFIETEYTSYQNNQDTNTQHEDMISQAILSAKSNIDYNNSLKDINPEAALQFETNAFEYIGKSTYNDPESAGSYNKNTIDFDNKYPNTKSQIYSQGEVYPNTSNKITKEIPIKSILVNSSNRNKNNVPLRREKERKLAIPPKNIFYDNSATFLVDSSFQERRTEIFRSESSSNSFSKSSSSVSSPVEDSLIDAFDEGFEDPISISSGNSSNETNKPSFYNLKDFGSKKHIFYSELDNLRSGNIYRTKGSNNIINIGHQNMNLGSQETHKHLDTNPTYQHDNPNDFRLTKIDANYIKTSPKNNNQSAIKNKPSNITRKLNFKPNNKHYEVHSNLNHNHSNRAKSDIDQLVTTESAFRKSDVIDNSISPRKGAGNDPDFDTFGHKPNSFRNESKPYTTPDDLYMFSNLFSIHPSKLSEKDVSCIFNFINDKNIPIQNRLEAAMHLIENSEYLLPDPRSSTRMSNYRKTTQQHAIKVLKSFCKGKIGSKKNSLTSQAQFYLGSLYSVGKYIDKSLEKAFELYLSSSKLNHPDAMYRTAVCYEVGAGVKANYHRSLQYYRKSAASGHTRAMYKLGMILLDGLLGAQAQPREAINWLKRAADNDTEKSSHALHELARCYESREIPGLINDLGYSKELYTKAAKLGFVPSIRRLAIAYEYSELGCSYDPRKSIGWYTRAAEQKDPESELALSGWYLTGAPPFLEQNDNQAFLWAEKASKHGSVKAMCALGYYYEFGIGTPKSIEDAKMWYENSSSAGYSYGKKRLEQLIKNGTSSKVELSKRYSANERDECTIM